MAEDRRFGPGVQPGAVRPARRDGRRRARRRPAVRADHQPRRPARAGAGRPARPRRRRRGDRPARRGRPPAAARSSTAATSRCGCPTPTSPRSSSAPRASPRRSSRSCCAARCSSRCTTATPLTEVTARAPRPGARRPARHGAVGHPQPARRGRRSRLPARGPGAVDDRTGRLDGLRPGSRAPPLPLIRAAVYRRGIDRATARTFSAEFSDRDATCTVIEVSRGHVGVSPVPGHNLCQAARRQVTSVALSTSETRPSVAADPPGPSRRPTGDPGRTPPNRAGASQARAGPGTHRSTGVKRGRTTECGSAGRVPLPEPVS